MKELKRLIDTFHTSSGVNATLVIGEESFAFGKELPCENNTFFDFLYKGEKCRCIIEGKSEGVALTSQVLKATLGYKDSLNIKTKSEYALKTLLGLAGSKTLSEKFKIDFTGCVIILIESMGSSAEIFDFLPVYTNCLPIKIDKNYCAFCISKKEDEEDYLSISRFAQVLYSAIEEELGIKVKIGVGNPVANFESINTSYLQAKKALELGAEIADKSVYTYTEILPLKMISSLTEKEKIEFLKPFKQILKNEELSVTAKEFLNNDLNSKRTAEKLFIHRNTLTYRLNKIEKEIGLDLRNFGDAVTFRMVCLMYNIKENNE